MVSNPKDPSSSVAVLAVILAMAGAASMTYYHLGIFIPHAQQNRAIAGTAGGYSFGNDFYPVWLTARAAQTAHCDPYNIEITRRIQTGLFGHPINPRNAFGPPADYRQFAYPAFADLILWPVGYLDFRQIRWLLAVVLPVLTIASIWFWFKALNWKIQSVWFAIFVALALTSYQLLESFFAEQPGLIVGFFLAASAYALSSNRLLLGGVLSSLTLIKPQMTALLIFYLLLWSLNDRHRFRFWQSLLAVAFMLMAGSLWIWPTWLQEWITILLGYHRYATPPLIIVLFGKSLSGYLGSALLVSLLIAGAIAAWKNRSASSDSENFWFTVSLMLAITAVTLLPGQAIYDHVILIPGILLVLRHRHELLRRNWISGALVSAGALVLCWPWIGAFVVIVLRRFVSSAFSDSTLVMLPIRTAVPLPFVVLALLWWTRYPAKPCR
jgi:hypothetical protein